ncbi:hypothetical protein [Thioclava nitratireducens]|uniref:hypothetical protein n=1 Tax=Thioclava nitratireducens TaxID=1915078 RepID=UPI0012FD0389|nr:hypothetical protein [Thioclava nitratireducens]
MTRWKELSPERQMDLRAAYDIEMARHTNTCSIDEKIARFAEWLAPQGVAFGMEDSAKG